MSQPALVSLLIPAYKSSWFKETLQSAFAQDYPNVEIIVSDDCPTDEIKKIVEQCKDQSPFPFRYIRNVPALGDVKNFEACVKLAEGDLVKFLCDDDLIAPTSISALVKAMQSHDSIRMATSRRNLIGIHGEALTDNYATVSPVEEDSVIMGRDINSYQLYEINNFIGEPSTVLMYRDDLLEMMAEPNGMVALNGEIMYFLGDLTMYAKIFAKGNLAYLTETLSSLRISRQQVSQQGRDSDKRVKKTHQRFPELIRELDMGDDKTVPARHLRIAPLSSPEQFTVRFVDDSLEEQVKESQFAQWINKRRLLPVQQHLLEQHLRRHEPVTLTILIDARDANQSDTDKTLTSLAAHTLPGLNLNPVVITDETRDGVKTLPVSSSPGEALSRLAQDDRQGWFLCLAAGMTLLPSGLITLASTLLSASHLLAIYGDEVHTINGKVIGARFRPDFSLDLFLSQPGIMARNWLWRGEAVVTLGFDSQAGAAFEFDLLVKLIETQGFSPIGHLAEPLFITGDAVIAGDEEERIVLRHLANRGYHNAEITRDIYGHFHIQYGHAFTPMVSVIISAGKALAPLVTCVTTVIEKTQWQPYELLVIADEGTPQDITHWLQGLAEIDPQRIKVLSAAGVHATAARNNLAASVASGQHLLFLHPDIAITQPNWIHALLNHGQRPEVGVVGGKQLYSDGTVRHAGYLLGVNGVAGEAFFGLNNNLKSYMGRLHVDQNYSAVSGDLLLVNKEVFDAVQGFDESLDAFWDVDFCLRVREKGWLTVWTPSVEVLRSVSSKVSETPAEVTARNEKQQQDESVLYSRWMPILVNDPASNVNLSLSSEHAMVCPDSLLSWRPLDWSPLPVVLPHMGDYAGCGYYRIIKPFEAMRDAAIVDGKLSETFLSVPYLERYKPDTIILQRQITAEFHEWASRVGELTNIFKVFELDDYLPNIPIKNHHRADFGKDIMKMLRKSLSYMDRFVVSTQPLADAFSDMHRDIIVMPNRLSHDWWGNVVSLREQGRKPRVGWAGGSSHTGDLEMIAGVIQAFADEVEWVFFGMCPEKIRPYVTEMHYGVDIELYPQKLASLNLDLALAPVEDNFFNTCKSNLRLLEYGACGIPVICSDVACYQGFKHVTRVRNRYKEWHEAIRYHLDNPSQSEQMGRELQRYVHRDWMLDSDNAAIWAKAWLPD